MPKPNNSSLSRTEVAELLLLNEKQRIIQLEGDLDDVDDGMEDLAKAIRFQTRAIITGLVSVIMVLVGVALGR